MLCHIADDRYVNFKDERVIDTLFLEAGLLRKYNTGLPMVQLFMLQVILLYINYLFTISLVPWPVNSLHISIFKNEYV